MLAGNGDIQCQDPHRTPVTDRVMARPVTLRQIGLVGKGGAKGCAIIVITGDDQPGDLQLRQQRLRHGIFSRAAVVDDIAADQHQIWPRIEAVQMRNCIREHAV